MGGQCCEWQLTSSACLHQQRLVREVQHHHSGQRLLLGIRVQHPVSHLGVKQLAPQGEAPTCSKVLHMPLYIKSNCPLLISENL